MKRYIRLFQILFIEDINMNSLEVRDGEHNDHLLLFMCVIIG